MWGLGEGGCLTWLEQSPWVGVESGEVERAPM